MKPQRRPRNPRGSPSPETMEMAKDKVRKRRMTTTLAVSVPEVLTRPEIDSARVEVSGVPPTKPGQICQVNLRARGKRTLVEGLGVVEQIRGSQFFVRVTHEIDPDGHFIEAGDQTRRLTIEHVRVAKIKR